MPAFLSNAGTIDAGCSDIRWTNKSSTSNRFSSCTYTLGVGGVDPVNNIILYIIILYTIYTYTAYGFPIRAASSRSAYLAASASDAAVCVSRVYDIMTMPLTTRVIQMYQLFHPPKKMGRQIPYIFCPGYPMDDPKKTLKFSWKSDD